MARSSSSLSRKSRNGGAVDGDVRALYLLLARRCGGLRGNLRLLIVQQLIVNVVLCHSREGVLALVEARQDWRLVWGWALYQQYSKFRRVIEMPIQ